MRGVGEERGDNDGVDEWDSFRCRDRYTSRATRRELSVVVESVVVAGRSTLPPGVSSCGAKVNVGSKEGEGSEGRGREGEGRGAAASGVDMNCSSRANLSSRPSSRLLRRAVSSCSKWSCDLSDSFSSSRATSCGVGQVESIEAERLERDEVGKERGYEEEEDSS